MSGSQKVEPSNDQMPVWEFSVSVSIHNYSTYITYSAMLCSIVKPRNRGRPSCQLGHLPDSHGALFAAELTSAAESSTCQTSKGRNTSSSVLPNDLFTS